jgi:serine-threonine kinase receptor-associated protein
MVAFGNGFSNGNGSHHHPAAQQAPPVKVQPLLCSGHTRPVVHLQFSNILADGTYLLISACKDGNPMLRSWLGDWIGTFLGTSAPRRLGSHSANAQVTRAPSGPPRSPSTLRAP